MIQMHQEFMYRSNNDMTALPVPIAVNMLSFQSKKPVFGSIGKAK
jgi:hypothetical protein